MYPKQASYTLQQLLPARQMSSARDQNELPRSSQGHRDIVYGLPKGWGCQCRSLRLPFRTLSKVSGR